ncbi:accessory gene regulator B family protein [Brevibacillus sp. SYSU BS000544]|uniref:accessory gene regulator B family protein n=1 Tax=Brevibacillus sp. SYSU BS000544 TaxID=3416443 RepID=UPI003CE5027A
MSIIENLSIRIARQVKANGSPHSVGVISHGIEIMMLNTLNTLLLLILALFMGCFTTVAFASVSYTLLRNFTGGVHFKNPWSCMIFGNILLFSIGWLTSSFAIQNGLYLYLVTFALFLTSFLINRKHAPAKHTYFEFEPEQIRQNRRKAFIILGFCAGIAFVLGAIGYSPIMLVMGLAVLLQALLLHPLTFKLIQKMGW